jgi:hypothetical protein
MEDTSTAPTDTQPMAKLAWEEPTIEELDFSATEAAYVPGFPNDLGIYTI